MDVRAYIYESFKLFEAFFSFIQLDSCASQDRIAFVIMTGHTRILLA